jgi:hypothetical protein
MPGKPGRAPRHNEWSREKMVAFLRELAASQSVAEAARAVGMSRTSAYNLRNRLHGQPFALGWEVAIEMGMHQLAHAVMDRAVNGVEVSHYYHGELVATTRRHDNGLARWVLDNPWKVGRMQVAREWSSGAFDGLLERIEWASLGWEAGEEVPGPGWPGNDDESGSERRAGALARQESFVREASWYAAHAREQAQGARGGPRGQGG